MHRRSRAQRRRRDETGVVAVVLALIVCFVIIPIAALAIDLGVQRVARTDMQSLADVVALDLARQLDGRSAAVLLSEFNDDGGLVDQSVARNTSMVGNPEDLRVVAEVGTVSTDPDDYQTAAYFTPVTGAAVPAAVRVTATTSVDFALAAALPGGGPGSGSATRSAVAGGDQSACFQLGSYALAVDSSNSELLNGLIGDALNLGVLGYDGLATAHVSLLGLATELGAGTPDELLALPAVSVGSLFLAAAEVLQREGGDTAQVDLLHQIGLGVGTLPPVHLADVVGIMPGGSSALTGTINVLDLVATSAFLANGENLLEIPDLAVDLGLSGTGLSSSLKIIEAARRACGHVDEAHRGTAQTYLDISGNLLNPPAILGLTAKVSVSLHAELASGSGTLRAIQCGTPEGVDVEVQNALTDVALTLDVNLKGNLGLAAVEIDLPVGAGTTESTVSDTAQVRVPPLSYTGPQDGALTSTPVPTGGGSVGLNGLAVVGTPTITATVLGLPVELPVPIGNVVSPVLSLIVNPLIANLDSLLLGPLTDLLGLDVAGSDVYGIAHPTCQGAKLVG